MKLARRPPEQQNQIITDLKIIFNNGPKYSSFISDNR